MRLVSIFASQLRRFRRNAGLSQEQLADLAGLDPNFIAVLEREEYAPNLDTLELLSMALQIDASALISQGADDE